ncbi:MAG: hypothetical protein KKD39_00940 [Candidatus Altiarchaeota archaeon]|nr:hypothetical protein [Candidatus Altiarchaeota archaeon]
MGRGGVIDTQKRAKFIVEEREGRRKIHPDADEVKHPFDDIMLRGTGRVGCPLGNKPMKYPDVLESDPFARGPMKYIGYGIGLSVGLSLLGGGAFVADSLLHQTSSGHGTLTGSDGLPHSPYPIGALQSGKTPKTKVHGVKLTSTPGPFDNISKADREAFLTSFQRADAYWEALTGRPANKIPLQERLALGKVMLEIDKKIDISFGQQTIFGGKLFDGTFRLYSPDELCIKIFSGKGIITSEEFEAFTPNDQRVFSQAMGFLRREFLTALSSKKGGDYTSSISERIAQSIGKARASLLPLFVKPDEYMPEAENKEKMASLFKRIYSRIGETQLSYHKDELDIGEALPPKAQEETIGKVRAKLAYVLHNYLPGCKDKIFQGLGSINLHVDNSFNLVLAIVRAMRNTNNPYAFWDVEHSNHGSYNSATRTLDLPLHGIDEDLAASDSRVGYSVLLHELGHVAPKLFGWRQSYRANSIAKSFSRMDKGVFEKIFHTDYGNKDGESPGMNYNPANETLANLFMLAEMGGDFPETIHDQLSKSGVDAKQAGRAYSLLKKWHAILKEHGYKGNPDWIKKRPTPEKPID